MTTRESTIVMHVVQHSISYGLEWEPWRDASDEGASDDDAYAAIGKAEMFHYFMLHGCYPEPFNSRPEAQALLPFMQAMRNTVLSGQKATRHRFRTRVIRRTIVSTITDEEIDKAMFVKYGAET